MQVARKRHMLEEGDAVMLLFNFSGRQTSCQDAESLTKFPLFAACSNSALKSAESFTVFTILL